MTRLIRMSLAIAIASATGVMSAAVPAYGSPDKNGTGSLKCQMTGTITFSPPLTHTKRNTSVKVSATLKSCTGSGDGKNVIGGTFSGTVIATSMNCNAGTFSTSRTLGSIYKVKPGTSALTPSTISFVSIQIISSGNPVRAHVNGAVTAGSFFTDGEFGNATAKQPSACAASWKFTGVPSPSTFELG